MAIDCSQANFSTAARVTKIFSMTRPLFVAALLAVSFAICGCGGWNVPPEAKTWKNPVPSSPVTLAAARQLYVNNCQKCHGIRGDGKLPPDSTYFYSTKPTNFTNARIVDSMSDGEIVWKITHGRKPMPAFKNKLSDEQRWELVNLIRAFAHPPNAAAQ
jgi:mono/diheme cytochrome c family protein